MTTVRSILYIKSSDSELKIAIVKELLPFTPSSYRQKGEDMIINGVFKNTTYRTSSWRYEDFSFNKGTVQDIQEAIMPILNLFSPYKDQLLKIKRMGFKTFLCIVISGKGDEMPMIGLNSDCIKILNELCLELSFDMYIY